ncbi:hypothetical protein [uncultured Amphritea sp.]|uniref:hypothetical protein n=1 Tax=uncultured Amphritea sp. TaxID=981605 RepID=UPI0025CBE119|nr:hypothetical protein [uncultured Amphritea sp.]
MMKTLSILLLILALQGCNTQQMVTQFQSDLVVAQSQINQLVNEVGVVKTRLDSINDHQE